MDSFKDKKSELSNKDEFKVVAAQVDMVLIALILSKKHDLNGEKVKFKNSNINVIAGVDSEVEKVEVFIDKFLSENIDSTIFKRENRYRKRESFAV